MPEVLISADSHVIEDPHLWEKNLPANLKDRAPRYPELSVGNEFQGVEGGWNPTARIKEMAMDNVGAEILYPSVTLDQFGIRDAALQEACFRVYNDWLIEYCWVAPDRLYGIAAISVYNIDNAVKEMERCKKAGMRGIEIWETPPAELPFTSRHYEKFWAASQDMKLPVSLHIATGAPFEHGVTGTAPNFKTLAEFFHFSVNDKLNLAAESVGDIIASGAFDRYPNLKLVLVENEVSWLPFVLARWDRYVEKHKDKYTDPLKRKPSEYFKSNIYVTFFNDPPLRMLLRDNWGIDNCMWSNDFPHPNSPWPNSAKVIERDLGDLSTENRNKLLRGNVTRLYELPPVNSLPS